MRTTNIKEMMNDMTVLLNYWKANKIDRNEYFRKYDNVKLSYKMLQGAPLLINIEGHCIKVFDIPDLVINRSQRVLSAVNKWLTDLRMPSNVVDGTLLEFQWRK